jgi:hypothetical protein
MVLAKLLEEVDLQVWSPHNLKARNAAKGPTARPFAAAPISLPHPTRPVVQGEYLAPSVRRVQSIQGTSLVFPTRCEN